jgi:hypothetical protein
VHTEPPVPVKYVPEAHDKHVFGLLAANVVEYNPVPHDTHMALEEPVPQAVE